MRYPLEALALTVALLALGGLPPLSGFMSKWVIFTAGFQSGQPWVICCSYLHGIEQCAFPGILCSGGEPAVPARSIRTGTNW